ncbi:membrane hypothetical protein [uncultured Defluviicoccus sp.]|uniref:Uncharacterized protein n=1 Tax=metagenome TaxID=256318 RepID=A0A380TE20_9ZZZZ|nr:membrane hypothetical protein [uncultured Defluviicoccus sp.]
MLGNRSRQSGARADATVPAKEAHVSPAARKWFMSLLVAALAPPVTAWASSMLAYDFGARASAASWPLGIALLGVVAGFAALSSAPFRLSAARVAAQVVYVPLALAGSWFVLLLGACSFGDCI